MMYGVCRAMRKKQRGEDQQCGICLLPTKNGNCGNNQRLDHHCGIRHCDRRGKTGVSAGGRKPWVVIEVPGEPVTRCSLCSYHAALPRTQYRFFPVEEGDFDYAYDPQEEKKQDHNLEPALEEPELEPQVKCGLCQGIVPLKNAITCGVRDHNACAECHIAFFKNSLLSGKKYLQCAFHKWGEGPCKEPVDSNGLNAIIPEKLQIQHLILTEAGNDDVVPCPGPNCHQIYNVDPTRKTGTYTCESCANMFCLKCLQLGGHIGQLCASSEKIEGTKPCPQCNTPIELLEGCNFMTCSCGTHFCNLCGIKMQKDDKQKHFGDGKDAKCLLFNKK